MMNQVSMDFVYHADARQVAQNVLYVEFLHFARSLNLTVQLDSPRDAAVTLSVSKDRKILTLRHDAEQHTITVPESIASAVDLDRCLPEISQSSKSTRLATESSAQDGFASRNTPQLPWTAESLGRDVEIRCPSLNSDNGRCEAVLVPRNIIHEWRDLPSEGWAEMMDLWHCHKPHEHEHENAEAGSNKGYAAQSKLVARSGFAFVDVLSFLLTETDCPGVQVSTLMTPFMSNNITYVWTQRKSVFWALCQLLSLHSDTTVQDRTVSVSSCDDSHHVMGILRLALASSLCVSPPCYRVPWGMAGFTRDTYI